MSLPLHAHNACTNTVKWIRLKTNTLAKEKKKCFLFLVADLLPEQAHCSKNCSVASESHKEEHLHCNSIE